MKCNNTLHGLLHATKRGRNSGEIGHSTRVLDVRFCNKVNFLFYFQSGSHCLLPINDPHQRNPHEHGDKET